MKEDETSAAIREGLESVLKALEPPTTGQIIKNLALTALLAVISVSFYAAVLMLIWNNCLVGSIDGIHPMNFWAAAGATVLVRLTLPPRTSK